MLYVLSFHQQSKNQFWALVTAIDTLEMLLFLSANISMLQTNKSNKLKRRKKYLAGEIFEHKKSLLISQKALVGVAGFEPATSASQTRRDNRATLHPEKCCNTISFNNKKKRRDRDSNPGYTFDVRRFSKPFLSATQAPLQ